MLKTIRYPAHPPGWTHRQALERRFGLPQGLLRGAGKQHDSAIARAVASTGLDGATLERLCRILTVTVGDWGGK